MNSSDITLPLCIVACASRPRTQEEKERDAERIRKEQEEMRRHPARFLAKFTLALAFIIFTFLLARHEYRKAFHPETLRHRAP